MADMIPMLLLALAVAGGIIGLALWATNRASSPMTKALTSIVSSHRFRRHDAKERAIRAALSLYRLDTRLPAAERASQVDAMLAEARDFDILYRRFHWGVRAEVILRDHLDAEPPP